MANPETTRKRSVEKEVGGESYRESRSFKRTCVRSGKWSSEEELLANRLVLEFENGWLKDCEEGCTLRSYLARKLNCAPMRISKKFAGRCIGKLVFARSTTPPPVSDVHILDDLEYQYHIAYDQEDSGELRTSTSSANDRNDITSAESGNESSVEATDDRHPEKENKSTPSSFQLGYEIQGEEDYDYGLGDLDLSSVDFFDNAPLYNESMLNCLSETEAIMQPHEWQDILSFFCDESCYPIS
eukprot:CAMPEP_0182416196 /NCGR_PEP_ID=MMETSP1167-20130531/370_1 /TAXON_ID=2988 /ORGANISM="Mallomonas Sp, Strain CCMP3275" /LENGTH=241 /DNA_ID=CAMNT_0024588725 /DNA_START=51 /DNA_END=776 /DNA_ORIENTATION=+